MKKILVTGGFGFLGSTLIDTLVELEPESHIHIVDNLSTNVVDPDKFIEGRNIKKITYSHMTVRQYCSWVSRNPSGQYFNEIYHLASIVGPAGVLPHAGRIAGEIIADAHVLSKFARQQKARLLFVSTSEVYGGGQDGYCSEDMACVIQPEPSARREYAVGKLAAETAILNQVKAGELDAVIVRPFNIAGQRQSGRGGFVLPRFIAAAEINASLTVFDDGQQNRALTDVRDVAVGLYLSMRKGNPGEIYNIGNEDNGATIGFLARMVTWELNSASQIIHVDPRDIFGADYVEANDKCPDSSKAREQLGWKPKYALGDIIRSAMKGVSK